MNKDIETSIAKFSTNIFQDNAIYIRSVLADLELCISKDLHRSANLIVRSNIVPRLVQFLSSQTEKIRHMSSRILQQILVSSSHYVREVIDSGAIRHLIQSRDISECMHQVFNSLLTYCSNISRTEVLKMYLRSLKNSSTNLINDHAFIIDTLKKTLSYDNNKNIIDITCKALNDVVEGLKNTCGSPDIPKMISDLLLHEAERVRRTAFNCIKSFSRYRENVQPILDSDFLTHVKTYLTKGTDMLDENLRSIGTIVANIHRNGTMEQIHKLISYKIDPSILTRIELCTNHGSCEPIEYPLEYVNLDYDEYQQQEGFTYSTNVSSPTMETEYDYEVVNRNIPIANYASGY